MTNFYVADGNNAIIRITVSSCLVVFSYNYFSLFTFHLNVILLQNYHFSPFHPINYDTYNKKKRSLQHFSHFLQRKSPPRSHHNYQGGLITRGKRILLTTSFLPDPFQFANLTLAVSTLHRQLVVDGSGEHQVGH